MKRYSMWCADTHRHHPLQKDDGQFVTYGDISAWMLELAAIAEKLPHANECYGLPHCGLCGMPPWTPTHKSRDFRYLHAFEPGKCNCPHGELIAKLGELK